MKTTAAATAGDSLDLYKLDEVPPAPAASFLGASPGKVERPVTPKALALALVNVVDSAGRLKSGLAVDVRLTTLISALRPSLSDYLVYARYRILQSTSLSFATIQTPGDSGSTDLGFGIRVVLADGNDHMRDTAVVRILTTGSKGCDQLVALERGPPTQQALAEHVTCLAAVPKQADSAAAARKNIWNRRSLAVAMASGVRLLNNQWGNHATLGSRVWASGSLPVGQSIVVLGQVQYDDSHDPSGRRNSGLTGALRPIWGTPNYHVFAEIARSMSGTTTDAMPALEFSGGLEFKASDQLWLSTGIGSRYKALGDPGKVVVAATLRWRVLTSPQFAP